MVLTCCQVEYNGIRVVRIQMQSQLFAHRSGVTALREEVSIIRGDRSGGDMSRMTTVAKDIGALWTEQSSSSQRRIDELERIVGDSINNNNKGNSEHTSLKGCALPTGPKIWNI